MNLNVATISFSLTTNVFGGFGTTNNYGQWNNANFTDMTFKNVNLRNIIGQVIWDKYDYFNITCINRQNGFVSTYNNPTDPYSTTGICLMKGLQSVGNNNQTSFGSLNTTMILAAGQHSTGSNSFSGFNQFTNTFSKGSTNVDLNIYYVRPNDFTPLQLARAGNNTFVSSMGTGPYFPNQTYTFCIVPIEMKHITYNVEKQ